MKIKKYSIILTFALLALLLSSCTNTATATNSWGNAAVVGDSVIFTNSTTVVALSTLNGSVRWTYPAETSNSRLFFAAPVISPEGLNGDEQVILGDYAGGLVSVSNNNGSMEYWQFTQALGKYIASPALVNNVVIAPNTDGFVYFVNLQEDKSGWTIKDIKSFPVRDDFEKAGLDKNALDAFWATPVADDTYAYVPNTNHYLYAIEISTAKMKWETDLGGVIVSTPLLADDGTIYIGTLNSAFFAVDSSNGSIKWQQTLSGDVWAEPILKDGKLYIGDESGKINVLDAADGSVVQTIDGTASILGKGADLGDKLVFANEDGGINAINADGSAVWMRQLNGNIYSNLVTGSDQFYILPTKGDKAIYAYDSNGNEIWNYSSK